MREPNADYVRHLRHAKGAIAALRSTLSEMQTAVAVIADEVNEALQAAGGSETP